MSWRAYAMRFAFGGLIAAITGLIAHLYGPVIGGLFLAFPAILPASLTLVEKHSGKTESGREGSGAGIGAVGLLAFGAVVWLLAGRLAPWLALLLAMLAWAVVSVGAWTAARRVAHAEAEP